MALSLFGSLFGGGAGSAGLMGLGGQIARSLGGYGSTMQSGTTSSYFPRTSLPFFRETLGMTDEASRRLAQNLRGLGAERRAQLTQDLDRQLQAMQGFGQQEIADINRQYDARRAAAGQRAMSSGLYNTTVRAGMQALADRERNIALGQARGRQQAVLGDIFGQRAQLRDRIAAEQMQALANLGFQDYALRGLLPRAVAGTRVQQTRSRTRQRRGLLGRLFG